MPTPLSVSPRNAAQRRPKLAELPSGCGRKCGTKFSKIRPTLGPKLSPFGNPNWAPSEPNWALFFLFHKATKLARSFPTPSGQRTAGRKWRQASSGRNGATKIVQKGGRKWSESGRKRACQRPNWQPESVFVQSVRLFGPQCCWQAHQWQAHQWQARRWQARRPSAPVWADTCFVHVRMMQCELVS